MPFAIRLSIPLIALLSTLACAAVAPTSAALDSALKQNAETGFMQLLDAADRSWAEVSSYRAKFEKTERRGGKKQDMEVVDYKYLRDHGISMIWQDANNKDKKVLFVEGKYNDQLNIQVKKMWIKIRVQRAPTASDVMENTNHPITESGFGRSLGKIRELTVPLLKSKQATVQYGGLVRGPDGQQCFKVTRTFNGGTDLRKVDSLFDAKTFLPVEIESFDAKGWLEKYTYRNVKLNPMLGQRHELNAEDFYRSGIFSEDAEWGRERETWQFEDVAKKWLAAHGGKR